MMKNMLKSESAHLDFGAIPQHTLIEGSFSIPLATTVKRIHVSSGMEHALSFGTSTSGPNGVVVPYKIETDTLGEVFAYGEIETDCGTATFQFGYTVIDPLTSRETVLFCETPYMNYADYYYRDNLRFMAMGLGYGLAATFSPPDDFSRYRAIVLHGNALQSLTTTTRSRFDGYLAKGGIMIVLANYYFRKSVMWANHLTEPYGIHIKDQEEGETICERSMIAADYVTTGVSKLYWFRPSPIEVSQNARLLVSSPTQPQLGFVACSNSPYNLYVVGQSLLTSLFSIGWPFDNARLLANILSLSQVGEDKAPELKV